MKNLEIYLTRHSETEFNLHKRLQGWADSPLTENGKQVAQQIGNKLRQHHFQAAFCSTLPRTLITAQMILSAAQQENLPITALNNLREYHFGDFEGKNGHELYHAITTHCGINDTETWLHKYRHASSNILAQTLTQLDPNAESENDFTTRIKRGIMQVINNSPNQGRVLVVTHGMVIVALLKSIDPNAILYKSPPNTSVSRLHFDGNQWRILSIAQTEFE